MRQNKKEESGQALVEFALLFTFLTLLVMGVLAFGLILTSEMSLVASARSAARKANLNKTKTIYCDTANLSGHSNSEVFETAINALGGLHPEDIRAVIIFEGSGGQINPGAADVLDANGNDQSGCYDLNHDGTCDCTSCPTTCGSDAAVCVHDICANSFCNQERCYYAESIGVQIQYNQEVPVPIFDWIVGDTVVLPAQAIFALER
jgi:Flp pilus assembly pilin Flp